MPNPQFTWWLPLVRHAVRMMSFSLHGLVKAKCPSALMITYRHYPNITSHITLKRCSWKFMCTNSFTISGLPFPCLHHAKGNEIVTIASLLWYINFYYNYPDKRKPSTSLVIHNIARSHRKRNLLFPCIQLINLKPSSRVNSADSR